MPSFARVEQFLHRQNVEVLRFEQATPTAEKTAAAVGCNPAEIAKSLLFIVGGAPVMVVASGDVKVKSARLKHVLGRTGKVTLPAAAQVEALTGYAPGGVCPFLLPANLPVYIDCSLRRFALIYTAAGNDRSAVPLSVDLLVRLTGGIEVDVCVSL